MPNTTISQIQFENDGQLLDIKPLVDYIYPIGSIYLSVNNASPAILFGGTWEPIEDTFLLAASSTYEAGTTGGSATMEHTHTLAHTHTMAHTHQQVATTSGGPSNNSTSSVGLSIAQMPSHNHGSAGYHNHTADNGANHGFATFDTASDRQGTGVGFTTSNRFYWAGYAATTGSGSHTHSSQGSGSGHSHTLNSHTHSTSATTTGGASNATTSAASNDTTTQASNTDNMPPYLAVYMWKRTA